MGLLKIWRRSGEALQVRCKAGCRILNIQIFWYPGWKQDATKQLNNPKVCTICPSNHSCNHLSLSQSTWNYTTLPEVASFPPFDRLRFSKRSGQQPPPAWIILVRDCWDLSYWVLDISWYVPCRNGWWWQIENMKIRYSLITYCAEPMKTPMTLEHLRSRRCRKIFAYCGQ